MIENKESRRKERRMLVFSRETLIVMLLRDLDVGCGGSKVYARNRAFKGQMKELRILKAVFSDSAASGLPLRKLKFLMGQLREVYREFKLLKFA